MNKLHAKLLAWYKKNGRDLPWRRSQDPYRIWISEIMLQQTRVEAVIPYYERFLSHFPTLETLAEAPLDKVTNLWAGLGYYSRARNIHKSAQMIVDKFNGKMPSTLSDLRSLPGIGAYTAGAIASIAFGQPEAAIDGNLERVIARLIGETKDPKKEGRKNIERFAQKLVALGNASHCNQGLMDLSNQHCLPKNPRCETCPLQEFCFAYKNHKTLEIPLKKRPSPGEEISARGLLLLRENKILLTRRKKGEWLQGMWDLPWWKEDQKINLPKQLKKFGGTKQIRTITKYKIHFLVDFAEEEKKLPQKEWASILHSIASEIRWAPLQELESIHLPKVSEKALALALEQLESNK